MLPEHNVWYSVMHCGPERSPDTNVAWKTRVGRTVWMQNNMFIPVSLSNIRSVGVEFMLPTKDTPESKPFTGGINKFVIL